MSGLIAKPGGLAPVLPLDVIHNSALGPCQQSGNYEPSSFAAASWGEGEDVFRTVVFQVMQVFCRLLVPATNINSRFALQERSRLDLLLRGPASRAMKSEEHTSELQSHSDLVCR